jgi:hypothetical protein
MVVKMPDSRVRSSRTDLSAHWEQFAAREGKRAGYADTTGWRESAFFACRAWTVVCIELRVGQGNGLWLDD